MNFENQFFEYFNRVVRYMKVQPLNLGGYTTYSGGGGGPPGGFTGYLPQTRVAYDQSEEEVWEIPASGTTLLDNLNRIRYRLRDVENIAASGVGVQIKSEDVQVVEKALTLDFSNNFTVTETGPSKVNITMRLGTGTVTSGVYSEDLTSQIPSTHFVTNSEIAPGTLRLYYNGLREKEIDFTLDENNLGFTLVDFITYSGDNLFVDYDTPSIYVNHTHGEYATVSGLEANYYTASGVNALLSLKSNVGHTHSIGDIVDFSFDKTTIGGIAYSGVPANNDVISFNNSVNQWNPRQMVVNQQYVFYIEGDNLKPSNVGNKNFYIYAHDVGTQATIDEVHSVLVSAPTINPVQIDVLKNGVTILPSYITHGIGVNTVTASGLSTTNFSKNDYFNIALMTGDITAANLTLHIRFHWSL